MKFNVVAPVCWKASLILLAALCTASANGQEDHAGEEKDLQAIQESAEKYVEAFNSADAAKISQLYGAGAELIDAAGNVFRGRKKILAEYLAFFKEHPQAKLRLVVESVRFVAPGVAIEDGRSFTQMNQEGAVVSGRYVAVHSQKGGRWQLASVRDQQPEVDERANLDELKWMIGRWVDEAPDSLLEIDCYWHKSGAYLIREFKVKSQGLLAAEGVERIGWDPVQKKIRSWLFDDGGGFMDAVWTKKEDSWSIVAQGFRNDGAPLRARYVVTPLRKGAYHLASTDRTAGEETLEDLEMTVVQLPPAAKPPATPEPGKKSPR